MSIFDTLLHQGLVEKDINRILRGENPFTLNHHINFINLINKLNNIIAKEIHILDETLVEIIRKHHELPKSCSIFSKEIAKKLYGKDYKKIIKDYEAFLEGFTSHEILEFKLRHYFINLIQSKCKFDIYSGENNLEEMIPLFLTQIDNWLYYISVDKSSRQIIEKFMNEKLGGSDQRLLNVIIFFTLMLIISALFLDRVKKGVFKTEHGKNIVVIISKIYFGCSLAYEQFMRLKKFNLEGGIAFRGVAVNLKNAIKTLAKGGIRGTAWTTSLDKAIEFAAQQVPKEIIRKVIYRRMGIFIPSLTHFVELLNSLVAKKIFDRIIYIFIDSPSVALKVLRYIKESKKFSFRYAKPYYVRLSPRIDGAISKTVKDEDATISIIYSYMVINDKVLLNLGEGALEKFRKESLLENKEIAIAVPRHFKLLPGTVDVVFPMLVHSLELEIIEKEGIYKIVLPVLQKNNINNTTIQKLVKELNKRSVTLESLKYLLKKYKIPGEVIGNISRKLLKEYERYNI